VRWGDDWKRGLGKPMGFQSKTFRASGKRAGHFPGREEKDDRSSYLTDPELL